MAVRPSSSGKKAESSETPDRLRRPGDASPPTGGTPPLSCFVAGIIQGSLAGSSIHPQDYRARVGELLRGRYPGAEVYDPFQEHPESVGYGFDHGREVFFDLMDRAGRADVVVAFVPSASMGTAIELWNAFHAGGVVVIVSPLTENWVVKFLADAVVPDLEAFALMVRDGGLDRLIEKKSADRARPRLSPGEPS